MNNKSRRKTKPKINRLAAALTGAAILSSALLTGASAPVADAAPTKADPAATESPEQTSGVNPSVQSKAPEHYKEVLEIKATAYAPGPHDNQQYGNQTHLGTQVRPGVIAVDPDIIPLGSRVYIQYKDGHGAYAVAEDTGGAIKGNRIDIAKWTVKEAQDFGIQHVKVFVLEHGTRNA